MEVWLNFVVKSAAVKTSQIVIVWDCWRPKTRLCFSSHIVTACGPLHCVSYSSHEGNAPIAVVGSYHIRRKKVSYFRNMHDECAVGSPYSLKPSCTAGNISFRPRKLSQHFSGAYFRCAHSLSLGCSCSCHVFTWLEFVDNAQSSAMFVVAGAGPELQHGVVGLFPTLPRHSHAMTEESSSCDVMFLVFMRRNIELAVSSHVDQRDDISFHFRFVAHRLLSLPYVRCIHNSSPQPHVLNSLLQPGHRSKHNYLLKYLIMLERPFVATWNLLSKYCHVWLSKQAKASQNNTFIYLAFAHSIQLYVNNMHSSPCSLWGFALAGNPRLAFASSCLKLWNAARQMLRSQDFHTLMCHCHSVVPVPCQEKTDCRPLCNIKQIISCSFSSNKNLIGFLSIPFLPPNLHYVHFLLLFFIPVMGSQQQEMSFSKGTRSHVYIHTIAIRGRRVSLRMTAATCLAAPRYLCHQIALPNCTAEHCRYVIGTAIVETWQMWCWFKKLDRILDKFSDVSSILHSHALTGGTVSGT